MPGFNGTGPRGMGPGSGWGRGPCGAGPRRFWCGGGRGRGWNAAPYGYPYPAEAEEKAYLENEVQSLRGELQALERRLENLKSNQES